MAFFYTTRTISRTAPRAGLLGTLRRMIAVRRQRLELADLDEAALKDLGITPDEARREAGRPAWDVPDFWRL